MNVERALQRISREVSIGKTMKEAYIGPTIYSHVTIEKDPREDRCLFFYSVMEYIDGETLSSWLYRTLRDTTVGVKKCEQCGKTEEDPIFKASTTLAARLYMVAIKHGIVQNDLKASNIIMMLNVYGNAFLIDYGQS